MSDAELIKWAGTSLGINALCFVIWFVYHKAQAKAQAIQQSNQFEQQKLQLTTMAEQHRLQLDSYTKLIEDHRERESKTFQIMERYAETLEYHGACLARVETKIDQNKFCPIARKESGQ